MNKRRGSLFPKRLDEVVKAATKPMMDKQGKLYGALLRDWPAIVGDRAQHTKPQRLQWPSKDASGAVLHIEASAAFAPELAYETEALLEQCARYFGYRAIARIVIHPSHTMRGPAGPSQSTEATKGTSCPADMTEILQRMRRRIAEDDKPDSPR